MKRYYQHHYNKVTVPFTVSLHEIGDYMSEYAYESISALIDKVRFTVTVENEPGDVDAGLSGGYCIEDCDIQPLDESLVLFRDTITTAVEDYVFDNEERLLEDKKVEKAFDNFYSMCEK